MNPVSYAAVRFWKSCSSLTNSLDCSISFASADSSWIRAQWSRRIRASFDPARLGTDRSASECAALAYLGDALRSFVSLARRFASWTIASGVIYRSIS